MKVFFIIFIMIVGIIKGLIGQETYLVDSIIMYNDYNDAVVLRCFEYNNNLLVNEYYKKEDLGSWKTICSYTYSYSNNNLISSTLQLYDEGIPHIVSKLTYEYDLNSNMTFMKSQTYDKYIGWENQYEYTYSYENNRLKTEFYKRYSGVPTSQRTEYTYNNDNLTKKTVFNKYNTVIENIDYVWNNNLMIADTTYKNQNGSKSYMVGSYKYNGSKLIQSIRKKWDYNLYIPTSMKDYSYENNLLVSELLSNYDSRNDRYYKVSGKSYEYDDFGNMLSSTYQSVIYGVFGNNSRNLWNYDDYNNCIKQYFQLYKNGQWVNDRLYESNINFSYNNGHDTYILENYHSSTFRIDYCKISYKKSTDITINNNTLTNDSDLDIMINGNNVTILNESNIKCIIIDLKGDTFLTHQKTFQLKSGVYILNVFYKKHWSSKKIIINGSF